jgi:hypothetical protein
VLTFPRFIKIGNEVAVLGEVVLLTVIVAVADPEELVSVAVYVPLEP